jgi:hypothetical protein
MRRRSPPSDENEFAFGLVQRIIKRTETAPKARKKEPSKATTKKKRKTWGREIEMVDPKTGRKKKFRFAAN